MVMKFGVIVPQEEIGGDVGALRAFVQAAEAMGFDHLVVFDSVLTENPGYEPLVLLGLYAGWTQRIGLMTGVIVAPSRPTLLLAKQAATVDVLSGGRLRLGLGVGWNQDEFTAMGADFQDRGAHIEEQMAVLRELWTKPQVSFEGRWHTIHNATMPPLPVQRPIPLWLGGQAEAVLRRVGRLADGWIPVDVDPTDAASYDQLQQQIARLYGYAEAAGRPRAAVGIEAQGGIEVEHGTEANWALRVERWRALGATHLSVNTMGAGLASVDAHIEMLRRVKVVLGS
jgi:probable F420-dependent oxidoreductase